ncbi:NAD(P)/FAD-dependent oxidoreductase [Teredinibacter sp. KSP-S5-2]|uniref:NAD(P)/FAD-dependent oxidoreductase n=1 Tax=Teredinibacter sp. KSP-S5-2 TaxID=3034506 RepID=UPI002934849B|nr:NAD(P)/FAD-dependent oxidoreductase [Teredinibacter sp. KSP-S5-2]WNO11752.1 NAD(P)/FAD-dependent oxidoreductase [Teredinibacter sp. KSP-S5-2]
MKYDVVILGGGAAGLMCAATAGHRGRKVAVLDHANKVGKKILMSGGGRCNFTNYYIEPENFISQNPHFCKSALSRYTQYDFISLVDKYHLAYYEKTKGQLFCENKAQDILNILLAECDKAGVDIVTQCSIEKIKKNKNFKCVTSIGDIKSESLVVATGGLSIPTMGATAFGFDIAKQFGLNIIPYQASLVPFTLTGNSLEIAKQLSGLSLDVTIQCKHQSFKDALLFTHRGLSGPAVLQITNYWDLGEQVTIDFLPDIDLNEYFNSWREQQSKSELRNLLGEFVPKRFSQIWLEQIGLNKPFHQLTQEEMSNIVTHFKSWQFKPSGTEGYRTAEVTRGGVDTNDISSKTFAANTVDGLYFIGEVLDVTGWLGGYNFQWAWSSGYCAGQYV